MIGDRHCFVLKGWAHPCACFTTGRSEPEKTSEFQETMHILNAIGNCRLVMLMSYGTESPLTKVFFPKLAVIWVECFGSVHIGKNQWATFMSHST